MMEAALLYLAKSSMLTALFFAAYHLLLRGETFFKGNRWFLLAGMLSSIVLPLVTFRKVVVVEPSPGDLTLSPALLMTQAPDAFDWNQLWLIAYGLGIAAMLGKFAVDYLALRRTLGRRSVIRQRDFKLVDTRENVAPFSYFNYIVYNSSLYDEVDLRNILEHEKVHSKQRHSIDMLLARIYCIAFWFNPFAWLYRQAVLQNLEFIADNEAVQTVADRRSYQITMLKVTAHLQNIDISNQFFQSLIKKRIVMLNKNQSKSWQVWKYLTVVPVLAAFLLYFQVRVVAQERDMGMMTEALAAVQSGVRMVIDKNTSDAQLKQEAATLKKEHGVSMKFSKVKRNSNGEITAIKAEFKDKNGKTGVTQVKSDDPINPISFYKNSDGSAGFKSHPKPRNAPAVEIFTRAPNSPAAPPAPAAPIPGDANPAAPAPPQPPTPGKAYRAPATGERHIIIKRDDNGQANVYVNGERVADGFEIMSEIESLRSDGNGTVVINADEIRQISREGAKTAREQLRKMRPELEKMKAELRKMERLDWPSGRNDEMSREEMQIARREMQAAREEMIKARQEMIRAKEELEKAAK